VTLQEADRTIAEFMGHNDVEFRKGKMWFKGCASVMHPRTHYTNSLDALVFVWEKLKCIPKFHNEYGGMECTWLCSLEFEAYIFDLSDWCKTIQQAAAIATAKAIKELGI